MFFQNILTNPIISQISFFYDVTLRYSMQLVIKTATLAKQNERRNEHPTREPWELRNDQELNTFLNEFEEDYGSTVFTAQ